MSAGVVGLGDQAGQADKATVDRLAFSDGTLAQPDHAPYPVAATLSSGATACYTATVIDGLRWTYLAVFNLTDTEQDYQVDLAPFLDSGLDSGRESADGLVYDYLGGEFLSQIQLSGTLKPSEYRYLVFPPQVGEMHLLGFLDKYVPVSRRQVKGVVAAGPGVILNLELPAGRSYTFALRGPEGLRAKGQGLEILGVEHREGLSYVRFRVDAERCSLRLAIAK